MPRAFKLGKSCGVGGGGGGGGGGWAFTFEGAFNSINCRNLP